MNESKDWSSIVEDKELLEFELSEHAERFVSPSVFASLRRQ